MLYRAGLAKPGRTDPALNPHAYPAFQRPAPPSGGGAFCCPRATHFKIKNDRYARIMKTLGSHFKGGKIPSVTVTFSQVDPELFAIVTSGKLTLDPIVGIVSLIAAAAPIPAELGSPQAIYQNILAAIHQDDDAHDTCSLTACLNPLHPGPCKGWKGTLHSVSPGAWHAIETARVEKANAARVKKIVALKAQGKPIPKKLLTPIVAKPNPDAGKTANSATGEAHAAGQAVSDAAGVKTTTPGKVSLGVAVKNLTPGPAEKGPKGKKPTVASKGIAAVIAQEKVTPQYKLDKAAAITPEQWAGLNHDDKAVIRGELVKIKADGFGPQQKKAEDLLVKLAESATPVITKDLNAPGNASKVGNLAPGTPGTITTPSGKVYQKVEAKKLGDTAKPNAAIPEVSEIATPETAEKVPTASVQVGDTVKGNLIPGEHVVAKIVVKNSTHKNGHKTHSFLDADGKEFFVGTPASKATTTKPKAGIPEAKDEPSVPTKLSEVTSSDPGVQAAEAKLAEVKAKLAAHRAKPKLTDTYTPKASKPSEAATPKTAVGKVADVDEAARTEVLTPQAVAKLIQKNGSADLVIGGKKVAVGFEGAGKPGKLTMAPGGFYTVTLADGTKHALGKGESVKVVHKPGLATDVAVGKLADALGASKPKLPPKHVDAAVAMSKGQAPGASWAKNQLAAYQALSADDFHGLAPDIKDKIVADLTKAQTKFLDPKKTEAAKALLAKFGHVEGKKPDVPKAAEKTVGFNTHLYDHNVTPAQAKAAVDSTPINSHFHAAKTTANLAEADNPDSTAHMVDAANAAKAAVEHKTKLYTGAVLGQPEVKDALADYQAAVAKQTYAESVQAAKSQAFNKISKTLGGPDQANLSPIARASLLHYQQHLLKHPLATDTATIDKLKADTKQAENTLLDKIYAAIKVANAPKPEVMTPAQIADRAKELLGPLAADVKPHLTLAEMKYAGEMGKAQAAKEAEKYPAEVLSDPAVAAKYGALSSVNTQIKASQGMLAKLSDHLKTLHVAALGTGKDVNGNPLSADDKKVIQKHAQTLLAVNSHLDAAVGEQKGKYPAALAAFHAAATKAQGNLKAAGPVTLNDYDQATIEDVYRLAWNNAAAKATTYGIKTYGIKTQMSKHPEYPGLKQDLADLQQLAGKLAVATGQAHTAKLNVPENPDTGAMEKGPEQKAWLSAVIARDGLKSQFDKLHKVAQGKLDTIRIEAGLTKRALPKLDSAGVKTAAAESAYYKVGGYSGPLYGKSASAKQYLVAKVGPDLAVPHKTSSDKADEKYQKQKADLAKAKASMPPPKEHVKPPSTEVGKGPNPESAASLGYHFTPEVHSGSAYAGWPGKGAAYVSSPEALADLRAHLTSPDTKDGIDAQKQFKWSISNMEGKGAATSGKNALYAYTGSSYGTVNAKLNGLPPGAKSPGGQITSIDNAFAAAPPLEGDVVLYRGFSSPQSVFSSGKWNDVNVAGVEWSQRSYSSTSGALSTAQSFAGYGGVVMRIIIPKEMGVKGINAKGGQHPGENEIILQRGIRYRVVADYGKSGSGDRRYIDVMVVPNPYDQPK